MEKKTIESIKKEHKNHIIERLTEEDRKSKDKIIEVIGIPIEDAKVDFNICTETYKPPKKIVIWTSYILGTALLLIGLLYIVLLFHALIIDDIEYTNLPLFFGFIFLAIATSLIYITNSFETNKKYVKNFKKIFPIYFIVTILLLPTALYFYEINKDFRKDIWLPNTDKQPQIEIDSKGNFHIIWADIYWTTNEWLAHGIWRLYYSKLDKNGNKIIDSEIIDKENITIGIFKNFKFKMGKNNSVHLFIDSLYLQFTKDDPEEYCTLKYKKINTNDEIIIEKEITRNFTPSLGYSFTVDINENVHLAYVVFSKEVESTYIIYAKINNKGDIKYQKITEYYSKYPYMVIDSKNNVYIFWIDSSDLILNNKSPLQSWLTDQIYLTKLDEKGEVIYKQIPLTNSSQYLWITFITGYIDNNDELTIVWNNCSGSDIHDWDLEIYKNEIYFTKFNDSLKIISEKKNIIYADLIDNPYLTFDFDENIYFIWKEYGDKKVQRGFVGYSQLSYFYFNLKNNTFTINKNPLSNFTGITSEYQSFIFDSKNNIHIVYSKEIKHKRYSALDVFYKSETKHVQITPFIDIEDNPGEVFAVGFIIFLPNISIVIIAKKGVKILKK